MDCKNIYCCQLCHSEFESEEDLSLHRCIEIKQEFQDSKVVDIYDVGQNGDLDLSEEFLSSILKQVDNLCDAIQRGDSIIERTIIVNQQLNEAVSCYRNQLILIDSKNVEMQGDIWDDCDNVMKSDDNDSDRDYKPKIKNKAKKNSLLNADSKTPTSKVGKVTEAKVLMTEKLKLKGFRALLPYLKYNNDNTVFECTICNESFENKLDVFQHLKSTHDNEISLKTAETKKKSFSKEHIDKMMRFVKSQCGNHSIGSMAEMVKLSTATIKDRIRKENIVFTKQEGECYFCVKKKSHLEPRDKKYDTETFLYLKYNKEDKLFYCSICNRTGTGNSEGRTVLLYHIKATHQKTAKLEEMVPPKKRNDCEEGTCKEIYGLKKQELWCKQCDKKHKTMSARKKKETRMKLDRSKEYVLCPDCGKTVKGLKWHRETMHSTEKQKCPKCDKEFSNIHYLKDHIKNFHEKVPCVQCGKLYGSKSLMQRHIRAQHTSNDEKKYKCGHCGKGFHDKGNLKDHTNIHTGEKPYKCKFCSACFASKGNHKAHVRSHLGTNHRSSSKN